NGVNLEGGEKGWFFRLMDTVDQSDDHIFETNEGVEPLYLKEESENIEEINPHSFIDPHVGLQMAKNIQKAMISVDPDHEDYYKSNGDDYINRLEDMIADYDEKIAEIPDEHKTLVTSECAFQYLNERYDFDEACIWKVDTEEN